MDVIPDGFNVGCRRAQPTLGWGVVSLFLVCACAVNAAQSGDFTYEATDSAITITKYTGGGGDVTVPEVIDGMVVGSIGYLAFTHCTALTRVFAGRGLKDIDGFAFQGCGALTGVHFAGNPPTLGLSVFNASRNVTVYYLAAAVGWGPTFGGRPTALWAPPGKANDHPAQSMTWYEALKWCNARSEKQGRVPAHYTDAGLTAAYRAGQLSPYVNWNSGYRLPTEAEWEKAARGEAIGHRYPWTDTDDVTHSRANYQSWPHYAFDTSPTHGLHPAFSAGASPHTSPVGYF